MKAQTILYIKNAMLIVREGSCKSVDACRDCVVHGPLRCTATFSKKYTCRANAVNISNGYLKQFSDTDILEALL